MTFQISSTSLRPGQMVPKHYIFNGKGCDGDNVSPQISWDGAPEGTHSYAVTVHDPDAPTDHGWWHWAVVNIPEQIHSLEEGASNEGKLPPEAVEVMTDFKDKKYGGPCPPKGKAHRYKFTVYAMKEDQLNVGPRTNAEQLKKILAKECLDKASFTVKYERH